MKFVNKITFSNIMTALTIVGSVIGIYVSMASDIKVLKSDNANIKQNIQDVKDNQKTTYNDLSNQMNQLRDDLRSFYRSALLKKSNARYTGDM